MSFDIEAACGCFIGNTRTQNQDNFCFNNKHLPKENKGLKTPVIFNGNTNDVVLFSVFDGMGGEVKGEEAAFIASEVFSQEVRQLDEIIVPGKDFLYETCLKANKKIVDSAAEMQINTMGTTVVALYFSQNEVFVCNIGDSKAFRIRNSQMIQISEDHTDEKILKSIGIDKKPVLLQYLGMSDTEIVLEPYISKGELQSGDIYVICSDGVTDELSTDMIYQIIKSNKTSKETVNSVITTLQKGDGNDNSTIIVIKIS